MNIIIGIVVMMGCIISGYMMHGGILGALWQPSEILIIVGAGFGAMIVGHPIPVSIAAFKGFGTMFKPSRYNKALYLRLLNMMFELFNKIRREGLIAIEADIEDPHSSPVFSNYPDLLEDHHVIDFIADYLRIMVSGAMNPHEMEALMDQELEAHHHESALVPGAITKVADGLPGFGIVAAVLGIVITMGKLGGPPEELGHSVAAALVGTLLGILFAYGFFGPFAAYMESKNADEARFYECIKACFIATMNGHPPQISVEFGRKVLGHGVRPSFQELDEACRAKK